MRRVFEGTALEGRDRPPACGISPESPLRHPDREAATGDEVRLVALASEDGDPATGRGPAYTFTVMAGSQEVGVVELRVGSTDDIVLYAGHIGYRVYVQHRGHHYALKACRLLIPLAAQHGLDPVWITCNPDNGPSRRTCELLGAELVETVELPVANSMYALGERFKCRYRLRLTPDAHRESTV